MDQHPRYEVLAAVASGDFATVYRGRDRELGRDVAIKQIHPQFLSDPRQLELYWREAQLLASLEHPHVMTIYDIVRRRGWLILELMQGNLQQAAGGQPLDLDFLRQALIGLLQALSFLHANGVIHGDVKPTNMLIDKRNRVKLGDFGLARRVSNDQGSLLKGTTKYMAPELVSQQFGPIGPASDLYSLGFAAYELMCGAQFEQLFPGLEAFGRDRQMAWMMWHAAPDRRLPPIARVLEGVPPDLARVIERLVAKDPAQRYRTADEALRDLHAAPIQGAKHEDAGKDEAALARASARKRRLAIGAIAVSALLSLSMLFFDFGAKPPPKTASRDATRGVIARIDTDRQRLVIDTGPDARPIELPIRAEDRVLLNNKLTLLSELKEQDRVVVNNLKDDAGRPIIEIMATRPQQIAGAIKSVDARDGRLVVTNDEGGGELTLRVPANLKILFNGRPADGQSMTLANLKAGDRIVATHVAEDSDRSVTSLAVQRSISEQGVLRQIDLRKHEVSWSAETADAKPVAYPLADKCEITLNGKKYVNDKTLKPTDLKEGDEVTIEHDAQVTRIDAVRRFHQPGIVQAVNDEARTLTIAAAPGGPAENFIVPATCEIRLGDEVVPLDDLRHGDKVDIIHGSPDAKIDTARTASKITAQRPVDKSKWVLLIGDQNYDDQTLTKLPYSESDLKLMQSMLANRYGVAPEQTQLLLDASRVRLEQAIPEFLKKVNGGRQLLVYYSGHAYLDDDKRVFLAPKDFSLARMATTGLELRWLLDQMEQAGTQEKLLLLDASHEGSGADLDKEPSSAEMITAVQGSKANPGLRTITVIASCGPGERGHNWDERQQGRFAAALADAFAGRADKNRDSFLPGTELFEYVRDTLAASNTSAAHQTPMLFLPNSAPQRLTEEAKQAIRSLAVIVSSAQAQVDLDEGRRQFDIAVQLAPNESEAKQLYGLLLLKGRQLAEAQRHLDLLKGEKPDLLAPYEATAWIHFERFEYGAGLTDLTQLVAKIPKPRPTPDSYPDSIKAIFEWVGRIREFAAVAAREDRRPATSVMDALDAAVAAHGSDARQAYARGREQSKQAMDDLDKRINNAKADPDTQRQLRLQRIQLRTYTAFNFDGVAQRILSTLDQ